MFDILYVGACIGLQFTHFIFGVAVTHKWQHFMCRRGMLTACWCDARDADFVYYSRMSATPHGRSYIPAAFDSIILQQRRSSLSIASSVICFFGEN